MNPKDILINDKSFQKLLHNDHYFRNIFKKTEKIVSVVFYILNNIDIDKKSETQTSNLASKAHFVHENALRTLEVRPSASKEVLEQFAQALIGLDSTLRVVSTTRIIPAEATTVVLNEIDTVLRSLNSYLSEDSSLAVLNDFSSPSTATSRHVTQRGSTQQSNGGGFTASPRTTTTTSSAHDRRERIKTILEAKGEATIKDISDIVSDCSEKTIQRELNAMIKDNIVKRQGERRWSKYSMH